MKNLLKIIFVGYSGLLFCAFSLLSSADVRAQSDLAAIGDADHGAKLYHANCASCHGFDGSGMDIGLKTRSASHNDGALMNSRDNKMVFNVIQLGCQGTGCKGSMPAFSRQLDQLDIWDLVAYLRTLHLPLRAFFPQADQYLVKHYVIGQTGNKVFKKGQMGRLKKVLGKTNNKELGHTTFTMFKADKRNSSPELIAQNPRDLARLKKDNKIGYVFFMSMTGPNNEKILVGVGLDKNFSFAKLVATMADQEQVIKHNQIFSKYLGFGKRGDRPSFNTGRDKSSKFFDKAVTRIYMLSVEAANAYEFEEKARSWADGTF